MSEHNNLRIFLKSNLHPWGEGGNNNVLFFPRATDIEHKHGSLTFNHVKKNEGKRKYVFPLTSVINFFIEDSDD